MALDVVLKQHDTRPTQVWNLTQTVGGTTTPVNLTTASSVLVLLKDQASATTGGGTATITNAAAGTISYTPNATTDTATVRKWNAEIQVTWSDGGIETFPNDSYFTIRIIGDLG